MLNTFPTCIYIEERNHVSQVPSRRRIRLEIAAAFSSMPVSINKYLYRGNYGESAGARTQDQRLKRAMLYQLSYALKPHYKVSTFSL